MTDHAARLRAHERIRELHALGYSDRMIAEALGSLTTSGVFSARRKLGLPANHKGGRSTYLPPLPESAGPSKDQER